MKQISSFSEWTGQILVLEVGFFLCFHSSLLENSLQLITNIFPLNHSPTDHFFSLLFFYILDIKRSYRLLMPIVEIAEMKKKKIIQQNTTFNGLSVSDERKQFEQSTSSHHLPFTTGSHNYFFLNEKLYLYYCSK